VVDHFEKQGGGGYELNDAARAAKLVRRGYSAAEVLMGSRVGLMMQAKGLANEVEYCAQLDILDVVARLEGSSLKRVSS
jgi:phosphosulfolactate phosphohydrolase-like enzyme